MPPLRLRGFLLMLSARDRNALIESRLSSAADGLHMEGFLSIAYADASQAWLFLSTSFSTLFFRDATMLETCS